MPVAVPSVNEGNNDNNEWAIFTRRGGKLLSLDEKRMSLRMLHCCIIERQTGITVSTRKPFARAGWFSGASETTLRKLHAYWEKTKQIKPMVTRRGKYTRQKHWSRHWITNIRVIAIALNEQARPVTVRAIQTALDLEERYGLRMSDRTLNRVLLEIGYSYADVGKAEHTFIETTAIKRWRSWYLHERTRIRTQEPNTIEIWLDESYCNQNHVARYSWYGKGDTVKRKKGKGRRWVIVYAGGPECGWVGNPEVFEGCSTGDYHENMDSERFLKYFEKLCIWMRNKYGERKVVFHMDNAPYHKKIDGLKKPLSKLNKSELVAWLQYQKAGDTDIYDNCDGDGQNKKLKKRDDLYNIARERFRGTTITEITAKKYKYSVLWIPPYHPMFNPIEEAWGVTKGFVAMHNNGSSFDAVYDLIFLGFKEVTIEVWKNLVKHAYAYEDKMIAEQAIATKDINDMIPDVDGDGDADGDADGDGDGDDGDDGDENEYEIEEVLDSRIENGRMEYLIKWKGYHDSENTWEPDSFLANARATIDDFEWKRILQRLRQRQQQRAKGNDDGVKAIEMAFDGIEIEVDDGDEGDDVDGGTGGDGDGGGGGGGDGCDGCDGETTESEDWVQLYRTKKQKGKWKDMEDVDNEKDVDHYGLDCIEFEDIFEDSVTQELLE
jgi:hypothetical protein